MTRLTILSAEFAHETNTFSIIRSGCEKFVTQDCFLDAAQAIASRGNCNTELSGFLDMARAYGWELIHVLSAIAQPRAALATGSGCCQAVLRRRAWKPSRPKPANIMAKVSGSGTAAAARKPRISPPGCTLLWIFT